MIAPHHCSKCGCLPVLNFMDANGYWFQCDACGNGYTEGGYMSETYAAAGWTRAVLSDLAAQERELWMRYIETFEPVEARNCVQRRYVWLGQNPLSLPT